MVRTRVGYAGGTTASPTYRQIGDHSETIQIDFDPARISYGRLLEVFWSSHDPCVRPSSTQYRSAIFTHDEEQRRLAVETKTRRDEAAGTIHTAILPFTGFTLAEDYHQKYALRGDRELMREFEALHPRGAGFVDSTAAARVNAALSGHGTAEALRAELPALGLPPGAVRRILSRVAP